MYHENRNLIHQIIFVLCILFSLISPPYNQGVAWGKETKTTSGSVATWVVSTVQNNWKADRKEQKIHLSYSWTKWDVQFLKCNQECKINTLTGIGIDAQLAKPLVENCKRLATDPRHCIIAWASIIMAESGGKLKNCYKFNCMWYWVSRFRYTSYEVQIIDWIESYKKYWYKAKSASFFYPPRWEKSKSRYCTSENSSGSEVGCPNGLSHASNTWNLLSKKF